MVLSLEPNPNDGGNGVCFDWDSITLSEVVITEEDWESPVEGLKLLDIVTGRY